MFQRAQNRRCTILPPKVHVVVTGIEKVLPTLEDLATVMRLLPRSATTTRRAGTNHMATYPALNKALVIDPSSGQEQMTDEAIDRLFD